MSKRAKLILNMARNLEDDNEEVSELTTLKNVSYNNHMPNPDGGRLVNTDDGINVLNENDFNRINDFPMYTEDGINLWLQQSNPPETNSKIKILQNIILPQDQNKNNSTQIVDMTKIKSFVEIKMDKNFCIESLDDNKYKVTYHDVPAESTYFNHLSRDGKKVKICIITTILIFYIFRKQHSQ